MKPIRIDFAPRSLTQTFSKVSLLARLFGLLGLVLCMSALLEMRDLSEKTNALQSERRRIEASLAKTSERKPAPMASVISGPQANAINDAVARLNLPWRDLLDAVESATPASIALLALEPDARKRILRGTAEAKTADDMIAYVTRLKQQQFFNAVYLSKHEVNEPDTNKPIRFQFEAHWAEGAP